MGNWRGLAISTCRNAKKGGQISFLSEAARLQKLVYAHFGSFKKGQPRFVADAAGGRFCSILFVKSGCVVWCACCLFFMVVAKFFVEIGVIFFIFLLDFRKNYIYFGKSLENA